MTLGSVQLVLAIHGSPLVLKWVLGAMVPSKILAAVLFNGDGMTGVAAWEAISGFVYALTVIFA